MVRAAVIGTPISHSRSPAIFGFMALQHNKRELEYLAHEVRPEGLKDWVELVRADRQWVGFNVTLPHKESIANLLDELAPEAQALGALNVVHREGDRLRGYNTDVVGIERTLEARKCGVRGSCVWLWGAGGAARAVAFVLGRQGAGTVYVQNRKLERAQSLAQDFGKIFPNTRYIAVDSPSFPDAPIALAVNSTSLGMASTQESLEDFSGFFGDLSKMNRLGEILAFDLIYVPEDTPFLRLAREHGFKTQGGLDMLIYQALETWKIWFGPQVQVSSWVTGLRAHLQSQLRGEPTQAVALSPIFLTGFMGCGKSTVGQALAKRLGWYFVDTDRLIEGKVGRSIEEIFREDGEAQFRALEKVVVEEACLLKNTVVSLGGGALMTAGVLDSINHAGQLVYLHASVGHLHARLARNSDRRPLLAGLSSEDQLKRIESLLSLRLATYRKSPIQVATDGRAPEQVATAIQDLLERTEA